MNLFKYTLLMVTCITTGAFAMQNNKVATFNALEAYKEYNNKTDKECVAIIEQNARRFEIAPSAPDKRQKAKECLENLKHNARLYVKRNPTQKVVGFLACVYDNTDVSKPHNTIIVLAVLPEFNRSNLASHMLKEITSTYSNAAFTLHTPLINDPLIPQYRTAGFLVTEDYETFIYNQPVVKQAKQKKKKLEQKQHEVSAALSSSTLSSSISTEQEPKEITTTEVAATPQEQPTIPPTEVLSSQTTQVPASNNELPAPKVTEQKPETPKTVLGDKKKYTTPQAAPKPQSFMQKLLSYKKTILGFAALATAGVYLWSYWGKGSLRG